MTDAEVPWPPGLAQTLLSLQEDSQLLVALFDAQDVLRHANRAFRQAYRAEPDGRLSWAQMMSANHHAGQGAVIEADDIAAWLASASARRGKQAFRAFELDLSDGRWIWMTETAQPQGWLLCVGSDITALRRDSRLLRQTKALSAAPIDSLSDSLTDGLTGLGNRRHGMQLLQTALAHSETWPLCVAALELDPVEPLQGQLGSAAGDRLIIDFARQLQASIRREDGCARMGGEIFLLILPAAGGAQAAAIVERLLQRVRRARPLAESPEQGYTVSAGLVEAVWGESAEALLERADALLDRARAAGRDRLGRDET